MEKSISDKSCRISADAEETGYYANVGVMIET